ncbi:Stage IV sporulation protein B [Lachnospiraceae bacterium TWA4]|nr:Stage IV sporulation protein B [Lachnospiraceae bacterium TWA4]
MSISPILTEENDYKLGVWIRDDSHGIGTLTYWNSDNSFGTLGHGMTDIDTNELLTIDSKNSHLFKAQTYSVVKGKQGNPGYVSGSILYQPPLGSIYKNGGNGVLGNGNLDLTEYIYQTMKNLYPSHSFNEMVAKYSYPLAKSNEISTGKAKIISFISGKPEFYEICIEKVTNGNYKNLTLKVTDEKLLKLSGGIIQGMSGSPIIQNGKLIGAVTHVLVNNPTKGYGIFIENMS